MHTTIGVLLTAACSSGHAAAPVSNVAAHVPAVALSMEHIAQKMVAAQICQLGAPLRNEKGKTQKRISAAILGPPPPHFIPEPCRPLAQAPTPHVLKGKLN